MWIVAHYFNRYFLLFNCHRRNKELSSYCFNFQKVFFSSSLNNTELLEPPEDVADKIIYNSLLAPKNFLEVIKQKREAIKSTFSRDDRHYPVSLKWVGDTSGNSHSREIRLQQSSQQTKTQNCVEKINLPFRHVTDYESTGCPDGDNATKLDDSVKPSDSVSIDSLYADDAIKATKTWMNDYERYCDWENDTDTNNDWIVNYGTADARVPLSDVACGGCGAYLHCQEPSLPGYLPSEIFLRCNRSDLISVLCQRCHFLKHYHTALSVRVNPDKYVDLVSRIKPEALVILMVDLTDIPGSVWPRIAEVLGRTRPLFLVGNKIDLLWGDRSDWLKRVDTVLRDSVSPKSNILDSSLISAKTGFGVEELVSKLHSLWRSRNDVYLVGCTNVGKSTLFNALIQSDYCKTKAVDLVQRATTAPWPGTTLNLLKFPILRPSAWRLAVRNIRLSKDRSRSRVEKELRQLQIKGRRRQPVSPPQLIGNISHSFREIPEQQNKSDLFNIPPANIKNSVAKDHRISLINSDIKEFEQGRWFYDTPGVLHRHQILHLLTAQEILLTLPKTCIMPRTFLLYEGMSLFVAGLARVDYVRGETGIRLTVFSSDKLPVTVCETRYSEAVYNGLLGSELLKVPRGLTSRTSQWPGLVASDLVKLCGIDRDESCADITFPTVGWIAVAPEKNRICDLKAWSPVEHGCHTRHPALLPFAVKLRGKKISKSPAYAPVNTRSE